MPSIRSEVVDGVVLGRLAAFASDRGEVEEAWAQYGKEIAPQIFPIDEEVRGVDRQLGGLKLRIERLVRAIEEGGEPVNVCKERMKVLLREQEQARIKRQTLAEKKAQVTDRVKNERLVERLSDFPKAFEALHPEGKKMLVRQFVHRVEVKDKDRFEITLKFMPKPINGRTQESKTKETKWNHREGPGPISGAA